MDSACAAEAFRWARGKRDGGGPGTDMVSSDDEVSVSLWLRSNDKI